MSYIQTIQLKLYIIQKKNCESICIEYRACILLEILQAEIIEGRTSNIESLLDNIVNENIPLFTSTLLMAIEISSYQLNYKKNLEEKEEYYSLLTKLFDKTKNTIRRYTKNNFLLEYNRYINSVSILPSNYLREEKFNMLKYYILSYTLNLNFVYAAINDPEKDYLSILRTGEVWVKKYFD